MWKPPVPSPTWTATTSTSGSSGTTASLRKPSSGSAPMRIPGARARRTRAPGFASGTASSRRTWWGSRPTRTFGTTRRPSRRTSTAEMTWADVTGPEKSTARVTRWKGSRRYGVSRSLLTRRMPSTAASGAVNVVLQAAPPGGFRTPSRVSRASIAAE